MQTTDLRYKLTDMLSEQITQTKRVIRKKEVTEMFRELHPKNYNIFVQQLEVAEKQEFVDAISSDRELLLQMINWIDDTNLKELIRSASDSATLCQSIPVNRFPTILNELEEKNILNIFNTSDDVQRLDIIHEIHDEKLTALFTYPQEESDLGIFLKNLDQTLCSLEIPVEEEEALKFERLPNEKQKVLQAVFQLNSEAIINIMQHQTHDRWMDYILENLLKSTTAERIMEQLTPTEVVNIMIDTEEWDHFNAFGKVLTQGNFNWSDVSYESQFELLEDLLDEKSELQITSLFTPEELAKLYTHVDRESKEFILNKVFPVLIAENEHIYSAFYTSLPNEQESAEFLKVMYQKARSDSRTANELKQMLEGLVKKTILEEVFLNSLIGEMPKNDTVDTEQSVETEGAMTDAENAYDRDDDPTENHIDLAK